MKIMIPVTLSKDEWTQVMLTLRTRQDKFRTLFKEGGKNIHKELEEKFDVLKMKIGSQIKE